MVMGRPGHDIDEMAIALLEWAKKPTSLNLCGFSAEHLISPRTVMHWAKTNEHFLRAYETVKGILGDRREQMLSEGKLHKSAYEKNTNTYDLYSKEESREQLTFESDLKNKDANTQIENLSTLIDQIKNGQISQTDS